jgi:hypothetical protein
MPKRSPKAKIKPQPNVLFEATVRRMLAARPQRKKAVKKKAKQKRKLRNANCISNPSDAATWNASSRQRERARRGKS